MKRTEHASTRDKGPKLPEKPKYRSLTNTAKAVRMIPYIIEGDPRNGLLHEDNFVVALGPLKYRSYANYENMFPGETLDNTVSKIMYVLDIIFKAANAKNEEEVPKVDKDDFGRLITPYGLMYGSLERNMVELAAYILSQHGRIVGEHGDGTYDYEPVTMDDIIDSLDYGAISTVDSADGTSLFFEILEVSGVWQPEKVAEDLKSHLEIEDDELKNSISASTGKGSSRAKKKVAEEEKL